LNPALLRSRFAGQPGGFAQNGYKINFQRRSDSEQRFQCWIAHFALNITHHLLRQAGALGDSIHGEAALFPLNAKNSGDLGADCLL